MSEENLRLQVKSNPNLQPGDRSAVFGDYQMEAVCGLDRTLDVPAPISAGPGVHSQELCGGNPREVPPPSPRLRITLTCPITAPAGGQSQLSGSVY